MAVDGTYNIEYKTPMGERKAKVTIKAKGDSFSGTFASPEEGQQSINGAVTGDKVAWSMEVSNPLGGKMTLGFDGKVTGNEFSGLVKLGYFGSTPFEGKRI
jgi:hypothetical protein